MNCPRCGGKTDVTTGDFLVAMLVECGCKTNHRFDYCQCPPNSPMPQFISGNWLTATRAEKKGDIWFTIWQKHNEPAMRDCRDLNYKYAVVGNKVICQAMGDFYDITEELEKEG